jgi:hypothetical protein
MLRAGFWVAIASAVALGSASPGPAQEAPKAIKAADLTQELAKDEKATKAKYDGKALVVEGKVVAVQAKPDGAVSITLEGHNEKEKDPIRVVCAFADAQLDAVKKVEKGATVKVKGEFFKSGSSLFQAKVQLIMCDLVK